MEFFKKKKQNSSILRANGISRGSHIVVLYGERISRRGELFSGEHCRVGNCDGCGNSRLLNVHAHQNSSINVMLNLFQHLTTGETLKQVL